jgi:hypothetical protein
MKPMREKAAHRFFSSPALTINVVPVTNHYFFSPFDKTRHNPFFL